MPIVPRYGAQRVDPAGVPAARIRGLAPFEPGFRRTPAAPLGVNAPAAAFDPFGGGLTKAAATVAQVVEQERRKADQIAVVEADGALSGGMNRLLYDPETGALNRRGKDAFEGARAAREEYDRMAGEIEAGLTSENQRLGFRRMSITRRGEMERAVQRHVSREIQLHDAAVTDALVSNERQAAVHAYMDNDRVAMSVFRQNAALAAHAKRNGLPAEWVEQKQKEAESKTHAGVLDRMLANGQDQTARDYLEANRAGIAGGDLARAEKAVEEGSVRGESQRQADAILAEATTREAALEKARAVADPKVRDETVKRVNQRFSERRQAETEARDDAYRRAGQIVEERKTTDAVPPGILSLLTTAQRESLDGRARHLRNGTEPVQNHAAWLEFLDAKPSDLARLSAEQLEVKYLGRFDNAHRDRAAAQWALARKDIKAHSSMQSDKDIIENAFVRHAVPKDKGMIWGTDQVPQWKKDATLVRQFADFEDAVSREVQRQESEKKRKLTDEEKQGIANGILTRKVFIEGWGTDPEKPAVFVTEDERAKAYVPLDRIPEASRERIFRYAMSIGAVRPGTARGAFEAQLRGRIEKAYGADLLRASPEEIAAILRGR